MTRFFPAQQPTASGRSDLQPGDHGVRIAYLILAHQYPEQLVRLVRRLDTESASFLIHLDKRTGEGIYRALVDQLGSRRNVHFVERHTCNWGGFGIIRATMAGINDLVEKEIPFDYLVLLSGQDYPIKTNEDIRHFFHQHRGLSFVHHNPLPFAEWKSEDWGWKRVRSWHLRTRNYHLVFPAKYGFRSPLLNWIGNAASALFPFRRKFPAGLHPYGGAQFWSLYHTHVKHVYNFLRENPRFVRFFRFVDIPDEIFFQTIVGNTLPQAELRNDTLTFVEWYRPGATLTMSDFERIRSTYHLFARKFDARSDAEVLAQIDAQLLSGSVRSSVQPSEA